MLYNPISSSFRLFYKIIDFKEIQNGGSKMTDPIWRLFIV